MSSRRVLKVAEAIREVVAMAILTEIQDPRVQDVTVTHVEVANDLRQAKVHVSIMGDDKKQELCLHGLRSSAGFLQQRINDRIDTRFTPKLKFELDKGVKNAFEVNRILEEVLPQERAASEAEAESTNQKSPSVPSNSEETPEPEKPTAD